MRHRDHVANNWVTALSPLFTEQPWYVRTAMAKAQVPSMRVPGPIKEYVRVSRAWVSHCAVRTNSKDPLRRHESNLISYPFGNRLLDTQKWRLLRPHFISR
jgi:hypothetical protein